MKLFHLLLAFLFVLGAAATSFNIVEKDLETEDSLWSLYERWRSHHMVSRDIDEMKKRFNVFKENARYIHEFNKREDGSHKVSLNMFADLTNQEFLSTYTGYGINHHRARRGPRRGVADSHGLCGLAMEASYPIKTSQNSTQTAKDEY